MPSSVLTIDLADLEELLGMLESTQVQLICRPRTKLEESSDILRDVIRIGFDDHRCLVVYLAIDLANLEESRVTVVSTQVRHVCGCGCVMWWVCG